MLLLQVLVVGRTYESFTSNLTGTDLDIRLGRALAAADLPPATLVASGDVGAIPYYSRLPSLDLVGLTDSHIAFHGLSHAYLAARRPDVVILKDLMMTTRPNQYTLTVRNGPTRYLDEARYAGIHDFGRAEHNGSGVTLAVATLPGFATSYELVATFKFGAADRYSIFVRRGFSWEPRLIRQLGHTPGGVVTGRP